MATLRDIAQGRQATVLVGCAAPFCVERPGEADCNACPFAARATPRDLVRDALAALTRRNPVLVDAPHRVEAT